MGDACAQDWVDLQWACMQVRWAVKLHAGALGGQVACRCVGRSGCMQGLQDCVVGARAGAVKQSGPAARLHVCVPPAASLRKPGFNRQWAPTGGRP